MANERGKTIDTTHLSIDQAEKRGFLHRDYIAHCLRWSHVVKYMNAKQRYKTGRVLDVGCGTDLPLAKTFYTSRLILKEYVGIDYNRSDKFDKSAFHTGKMPVHAYGGVDFAKHVTLEPKDKVTYKVGDVAEHELPSVITCFEVLEHVEPEHAKRMLLKMSELLVAARSIHDEVRAFISTPCWNPHVGAAANHVSEIRREALGAVIEDCGFAIVGNWGTFASMRDYRDHFIADFEGGREIWDGLCEYYDSNYLATVLAPLYPQYSRNNLWEIAPAGPSYQRQFPQLDDVEQPWSSSGDWMGFKDWKEGATE